MEMGIATPSVHVTTVEPHVSPTPHVSDPEPHISSTPKVSETDTKTSHVVPVPSHTGSHQTSSYTSASQGQGCNTESVDESFWCGVIALTGLVIFCAIVTWGWHKLRDLEW